jgi:hypothetical protein
VFIELLPRMAISFGSTILAFGHWGTGGRKIDVVFSMQSIIISNDQYVMKEKEAIRYSQNVLLESKERRLKRCLFR